ncbi:MAG: AsnC family protein [Candidatus Bathyarchaeota archaeon]|nr:MAG: AsnC family protein [Candidatus Bathyarchaeota archaeon]
MRTVRANFFGLKRKSRVIIILLYNLILRKNNQQSTKGLIDKSLIRNHEKLKKIDYMILFKLTKNSKFSDRKLARKFGVSQPTVTRRRAALEKWGC